jgi:MYXO-CTERM domain-containing protein
VHTFEFDAPTQLFGGVTELRITIGGATSSTGNIRFDNLRLESRSVPTPGALALLGLGATVARSRRRR